MDRANTSSGRTRSMNVWNAGVVHRPTRRGQIFLQNLVEGHRYIGEERHETQIDITKAEKFSEFIGSFPCDK